MTPEDLARLSEIEASFARAKADTDIRFVYPAALSDVPWLLEQVKQLRGRVTHSEKALFQTQEAAKALATVPRASRPTAEPKGDGT